MLTFSRKGKVNDFFRKFEFTRKKKKIKAKMLKDLIKMKIMLCQEI